MVCLSTLSAMSSGVEVGVPGEAAEGVEVGHGERRTEPAIAADAGDADHAAQGLMERLACEDVLTGLPAVELRMRARVCDLSDATRRSRYLGPFPHGREIDEVALLAGVLLRDLDFHGLAGVPEAGEERRDGLADLEVDGAFLDLDDDVGQRTCRRGGERCRRRRGRGRLWGRASRGGGCRRRRDRGRRRGGEPARAASMLAASAGVRPKLAGPGWPSESALTVKPAKSGMRS